MEKSLLFTDELEVNTFVKDLNQQIDAAHSLVNFFVKLEVLPINTLAEVIDLANDPIQFMTSKFEERVDANPSIANQLKEAFGWKSKKLVQLSLPGAAECERLKALASQCNSIGSYTEYLTFKNGTLSISDEGKNKIIEMNSIYMHTDAQRNYVRTLGELVDKVNEVNSLGAKIGISIPFELSGRATWKNENRLEMRKYFFQENRNVFVPKR